MRSKVGTAKRMVRKVTRRLARPLLACAMMTVFITYTTGCSLFASSQQMLSVTSEPDGAEVKINGQYLGDTPLQTNVKRKDALMITVTKEGYKTGTRSTSTKLSTLGIIDIVGTCIWLVPIIGLLGGGAWEQDPANVHIPLSKKDE